MKIEDYPEVFRKVKAVRKFAEEMGYDTDSWYYTHFDNDRPAFVIVLLGTFDSEGNPFDFAWYMDTGEEITGEN